MNLFYDIKVKLLFIIKRGGVIIKYLLCSWLVKIIVKIFCEFMFIVFL